MPAFELAFHCRFPPRQPLFLMRLCNIFKRFLLANWIIFHFINPELSPPNKLIYNRWYRFSLWVWKQINKWSKMALFLLFKLMPLEEWSCMHHNCLVPPLLTFIPGQASSVITCHYSQANIEFHLFIKYVFVPAHVRVWGIAPTRRIL